MINYKHLVKLNRKFFSSKSERTFLLTGCCGQIGSALVPKLYDRYGVDNVICTDVVNQPSYVVGKYHSLDVSDHKSFRDIAMTYKPTDILHLAAILSGITISKLATGEKNPDLAIKVNIGGVNSAFEIAKELNSK